MCGWYFRVSVLVRGFQKKSSTLVVPSHWGKIFVVVRVGQVSFFSQVLHLPLGIPAMPMPGPAMLHTQLLPEEDRFNSGCERRDDDDKR